MSDAHTGAVDQREELHKPPPLEDLSSRGCSPRSDSFRMSNGARPRYSIQPSGLIKITEILDYMKRAFDDETALDTLPLEAAGNSGAWKAWRAYRRGNEKESKLVDSVPNLHKQDEWNWDGVWEERVRKGIDASIADSTLYGASGGDDLVSFPEFCTVARYCADRVVQIRFVDAGDDLIGTVKAEVVSHVGGS